MKQSMNMSSELQVKIILFFLFKREYKCQQQKNLFQTQFLISKAA